MFWVKNERERLILVVVIWRGLREESWERFRNIWIFFSFYFLNLMMLFVVNLVFFEIDIKSCVVVRLFILGILYVKLIYCIFFFYNCIYV